MITRIVIRIRKFGNLEADLLSIVSHKVTRSQGHKVTETKENVSLVTGDLATW